MAGGIAADDVDSTFAPRSGMLGPMDRDEICARFLEAVEFDLYAYQEEALLAWFEEKDGVLVCAPTGMGKTLIAEAAVFEALHTRRQLYYTTPLIALTDQKFRDLQDQVERWGFSRDDVGLITGNRRENPGALVRVRTDGRIPLPHSARARRNAREDLREALGHGAPGSRPRPPGS